MSVFGNYSKYYDLLYEDKDYSGEADYICKLFKNFAPNIQSILELGCGTGKHAKLLSEKGYDVYGVDLSETMLKQAKELGVKCELGDVRTFKADKKFDAVISLFHVVSYQTTDEDVLNYFNTASSHLNKGGIFIFDLWYKPAVLSQLPERRSKELENNEIKVKRLCVPNHIEEKSIVEVNYDIEILDKKLGEMEKISEKHLMRYFSMDEIKKFAKQKDIEVVHSEEWMTGKAPNSETWGVCFVGVKK